MKKEKHKLATQPIPERFSAAFGASSYTEIHYGKKKDCKICKFRKNNKNY